MHSEGDYEGAIEVIQAAEHWECDSRSWRLIGLCSQGLARYEQDLERRQKLYRLALEASAEDRAGHILEAAKSDVNLASALIDQLRYDEALAAAERARSLAPKLPTGHVAILGIHNRQRHLDEVLAYLRYLAKREPWIFDNPVFSAHVASDPDLAGVADLISTLERSSL